VPARMSKSPLVDAAAEPAGEATTFREDYERD